MLYSRSRFSWELSEIGAAKPDRARLLREAPAAFRRLCVETYALQDKRYLEFPAAFRRLCVETKVPDYVAELETPSRLQAAVC